MCDDCKDPMAWTIDENDMLLVPVADITENTPTIYGWEPIGVNVNFYDPRETGIAKTFIFRQTVETYFICAYREDRIYAGPEEGGWGYSRRSLMTDVVWSVGDRKWAVHACRALNRLARKNEVAPGPFQWDTSGIVFAVDRWIGEDDNSNDPRPHYC